MEWITSDEAERQLLGAILAFNDQLPEAMPLLPEWFADPAHQIVFEEILRAESESRRFDYRALAAEMTTKRLNDVGGTDGLIRIHDSVNHFEDIRANADRVRGAHMARECLKLQAEEARALELREDSIGEIVAKYSKLRMDLLAKYERSTVISIGEAASRHVETIRELRQGVTPDFLPMPWRELTLVMGGLRPGRLIVIAAATSSGKTTLALNIGFHVAHKFGVKVQFQSLEMDANPDLVAKVESMITGVPGDLIDWPKKLTDYDFAKIERAADELPSVHLDFDDSAYQTPSRVMMGIRLAVAKGARLAIVDLLQNLHYTAEEQRRSSLTERIGQAMRDFKQLARDLQIPIILVSQVNRKADEQERPRLSNLADSAWIERSADQVLLLHRPNEKDEALKDIPRDVLPEVLPRLLLAELAKNRGGRKHEFLFLFDAPRSLFHIYDTRQFLNGTDQAVIDKETVDFRDSNVAAF